MSERAERGATLSLNKNSSLLLVESFSPSLLSLPRLDRGRKIYINTMKGHFLPPMYVVRDYALSLGLNGADSLLLATELLSTRN